MAQDQRDFDLARHDLKNALMAIVCTAAELRDVLPDAHGDSLAQLDRAARTAARCGREIEEFVQNLVAERRLATGPGARPSATRTAAELARR